MDVDDLTSTEKRMEPGTATVKCSAQRLKCTNNVLYNVLYNVLHNVLYNVR